MLFFCSRTSGPLLTQASISKFFVSFTASRTPFSLLTINSYVPVSSTKIEPSQWIENSSASIFSGSGLPPLK